MRGVLSRTFNLGIGALRFYTLTTLVLVVAALFAHDGKDLGIGAWLAWCLAAAIAAAIAGSLGAELRLISGARAYRVLPDAQRKLALSAGLVFCIALLPTVLITLLHPPGLGLLGVATALGLLFLSAGLWLGINGAIYLAVVLMFAGLLTGWIMPDLASRAEMVGMALLVTGMLVLWRWNKRFGSGKTPGGEGSFRAWLWHRPHQAIGWRTLAVHGGVSVIVLGAISLPYLDPTVSLPGEPSALAHIYAGVAYVTTMMLSIVALNEALLYRQRMRRLLLFPGHDRRHLYAGLEAGLFRLLGVLGIVPSVLILALATMTGQTNSSLALMAVLTLSTQAFVGFAALAAAAGRDGGIALVVMVCLVIGSFVLLALLNSVMAAEQWPVTAWVWLGAAVLGSVWLRHVARKAWRTLSLESIDHWLILRLAHQQWRNDI